MTLSEATLRALLDAGYYSYDINLNTAVAELEDYLMDLDKTI